MPHIAHVTGPEILDPGEHPGTPVVVSPESGG
jgi:hypothetical protein